MKTHIINCDKPKIPFDGWTIESHRKMGKLEWNAEEIALYLSEKQKSGYIEGNDLRKELEGKPVLNACVLDYLLKHHGLIPESWKGQYVYFWGTIFRDALGGLFVRCLCWLGDRWNCYYRWLDRGWDGQSPAASLASLDSGSRNLGTGSLSLESLARRMEKIEKWIASYPHP